MNIEIKQLDYDSGEVIAVYPSMKEAAKHNGLLVSSISLAISSRGGFMAKYKLRFSSETKLGRKLISDDTKEKIIAAAKYMLENDTSIGKTATEFEMPHSTLSYYFDNCLRKIDKDLFKKVQGLIEFRRNNGIYYRTYSKVEQIDIETNEVIEKYNSVEDAAEDNFLSSEEIKKALKINKGVIAGRELKFRRA